MLRKALSLAALISLGLAGLHTSASAQLDFHVNLDTSSLSGGMFFVDFSLSDGSVASLGLPDTNNNVTLSNFVLGGGSAGAIAPPTLGLASGNIAAGFNLSDGDPLGSADIAQGFTAGNVLSFDAHLTTNVDAGGTPDLFLFHLLDSGQNTIVTNDSAGNNGFVTVMLNSPTLTVGDIGAFASANPPLGRPTITGFVVPEPGALALLTGGGVFGGLMVLRHRRYSN